MIMNKQNKLAVFVAIRQWIAVSVAVGCGALASGAGLEIQERGYLTLPSRSTAYKLAVTNGHAYIAAGTGGFVIANVQTPTAPRLLPAVSSPGMVDVRAVAVSGRTAVVTDSAPTTLGSPTLRTFDISFPASAAQLDTWGAVDFVRGVDVAMDGGHAFLATESLSTSRSTDYQLRVVGIEDAANIVSVDIYGSIRDRDGEQGVAVNVVGDVVCLLTKSNVVVLDAAKPNALSLFGRRSQLGGTAIYSDGDLAFVGTSSGVCVILDITMVPLQAVGSLTATGPISGIVVSDGLAYVSVKDYGVEVFELEEDDGGVWTGRRVGGFETRGSALGLAVVEPHVYVADGASGISILEVIEGPKPTPPVIQSFRSVGDNLVAPASITLEAVAVDADGRVVEVEFRQGGTVLGVDTAAPFSWRVNGLGGGQHVFTAVAKDDSGLTTSATVTVSVRGPTVDPSLVVRLTSPGYSPGETATVGVAFTHDGGLTALGLQLQVPPGWRYLSDTGTAQIKPGTDGQGLLEWGWFSGFPASGSEFVVSLGVPAGDSGPKSLSGMPLFRRGGPELRGVMEPDPLVLEALAPFHSADISRDWRFSLSEVLRVAGLFNFSAGGNRTGEYHVQAGSEDGFGEGPGSRNGRNHSADTNRDWKLSLSEVLRVASLFNYSANNQRTGEYHARNGTEDGYEAGPATGSGVASSGAREGGRRNLGLMAAASEQAVLESAANGYVAGNEVTLTLNASYVGSLTAFGWELDLPAGWSYVSDTATAQIKPNANQVGTLEWGWFTGFPASGAGFTVQVRVPSAQTGEAVLQARALLRDPARTLSSVRLTLSPRSPPTGPVITTQPSGALVASGDGVVLEVVAQGSDLAYQWQFNGVDIPGATGARLEFADITAGNAGRYSVEVSNSAGSVTSQAAVVRFFGDVRLFPGMTIAGEAGDRFRIEYADAVGGGDVWNVATNLVHPGGVHLYVDPAGLGGAQRYYRAALLAP